MKLVAVAVLGTVVAVVALSVFGRAVFRLPASERLKSFAIVTPQGPPHTISGKVTDAKTGKPLAGASVHVERTELEAMTDRSGDYSIAGVATGQCRLGAFEPRYHDCRTAVMLDSVRGLRVDFRLVDDFVNHPIWVGEGR